MNTKPWILIAALVAPLAGCMEAHAEGAEHWKGEGSVIGIDGHDLGALIGLTTVAQDAAEQGVRAATMLLDLVAGGAVPQVTTFPTRLVVRSSTGVAPRR